MVKQMDIVDGEELLRSQSLYEMIKHTKHRLSSNRNELRNELQSFAKLQERLLTEQATRANIQKLSLKKDKDTQTLIQQALDSTSGFVNLSELEKLLQSNAKLVPS